MKKFKYAVVKVSEDGDVYDLNNTNLGALVDTENMDLHYINATISNELSKDSIGELSDGYHTFNELYNHRMALFACLVSGNGRAWKSKLHDDGTMYPDYFIVGINTDYGQVSYHYHIDFWDYFKCMELDRAPQWDGHTANDTIDRMMRTYAR